MNLKLPNPRLKLRLTEFNSERDRSPFQSVHENGFKTKTIKVKERETVKNLSTLLPYHSPFGFQTSRNGG